MPIVPIDIKKIEETSSNIYEAVVACSKRARMLNDEYKLEFNAQLSTVIPGIEDEFDDKDNSEQVRISSEFELREKPHLQAIKELLNKDLLYRYKDKID